jgi:ATP-dependent Clp protease protease subunit
MPKLPPVRCFEGTAKPYEPFWRALDATQTAEAEIELYGYISEYSWLGDEITPAMFKDDLQRVGAGKPVTVRINSGGGEVIAASVIRAILTDYPGRVTVRIDGLCASSAVMVAMAGDTVRMMDSAYMMVHDPGYNLLMGWLTEDYLKSLVDQLKSIKSGMLDTYSNRTGLSLDRLNRMLTDETWMSAGEAVKMGFADEVISGGKSADKNASVTNALKNFLNVPPALVNNLARQVEQIDREAQRLRDEVQILA